MGLEENESIITVVITLDDAEPKLYARSAGEMERKFLEWLRTFMPKEFDGLTKGLVSDEKSKRKLLPEDMRKGKW